MVYSLSNAWTRPKRPVLPFRVRSVPQKDVVLHYLRFIEELERRLEYSLIRSGHASCETQISRTCLTRPLGAAAFVVGFESLIPRKRCRNV
ncbi:hypothetical protein PIB30_081665 [Stylosanthes scabra]|uniref:Uncharacterized protein n=1 Tax=Stylosanthes scabra TaxID=79078 RepID=A0ABU6URD0_9FABA|nr:hypothetical protein [Stylosanthes scabra]